LYLRVVEAAGLACRTDRQKLERVVSNLVDNAIKHTISGGVELSASAQGEKVVFRISDTGSGIPPEKTAYLFDEFYQVNNHERDRNKGFGLGLAICRSLARQLEGDVRLASTGKQGSCFELIVQADSSGGRGRSDSQEDDCPDPAPSGLCPV
jgi:signal transduction histidine kinase